MKKYLVLLALLSSAHIYAVPHHCLITENSIGKIKLGQTLAQVKQAYPKIKISFKQDAEGVQYAVLPIASKTIVLAHLIRMEIDDGKISQGRTVIDRMETQSANCQTASGIHPNMRLSQVQQHLGNLKIITMSEIEMRQFAEFSRQEKWLTIRVEGGDFGTHDELNLPMSTRKFVPNARIISLGISM